MRISFSNLILLICFSIFIFFSNGIIIGNDKIEIFFDASNRLTSITNKLNGAYNLSFVSSEESTCIWSLHLVAANNKSYTVSCNNSSTQQKLVNENLILTWDNIKVDDVILSLSIQVIISLGKEEYLSDWKISAEIKNKSEISIWSINFPIIEISPQLKNQENTYFVNSGVLGKQYRHPFYYLGSNRYTYPSGDQSMQYLTYYENYKGTNYGLYFGTHDSDANTKHFNYFNEQRLECVFFDKCKIGLDVECLVEGAGESMSSYTLPYSAKIGVYLGDWYDASQIYRNWVLNNAAWGKVKLIDRNLHASYVENAMWFNTGWQPYDVFNVTQGDPDVVLEEMRAIRKVLGNDIVIGLHWYVWYQAVNFDMDYPKYFPAKNGFESAVKELQSMNIIVMPYINGRIFDTSTPLWRDNNYYNEQFAIKKPENPIYSNNPNLKLDIESYGNKVPFAVMCPSQNFWQKTISNVTKTLFGVYNVDAVYIDQIGAAGPRNCFVKEHKHTIGGGSYWANGYRDLLKDIRSEYPSRVIVTEENAEPYGDLVNGNLVIVGYLETEGISIPMYQSVYGGYAVTLGRIFTPTDFSNGDLFCVKILEMFVFGSQMGWFSLIGEVGIFDYFVSETYSEEISYLKKLSSYKNLAKDFFVYGKFMRPFSLKNNVPIIYSVLNVYSSIMVSAFKQLDKNDTMALFIGNAYSKEISLDVSFELNLANYEFVSSQLPIYVYRIHENGTQSIQQKLSSLYFSFNSTIPQRDLFYFQFVSANKK